MENEIIIDEIECVIIPKTKYENLKKRAKAYERFKRKYIYCKIELERLKEQK